MRNDYPNIIVTRDAPLVVREPSARMCYGTVYMEMGAYMEIRAGSQFHIDKIEMLDASTSVLTECVDYPSLTENEPLGNWDYHIIVTGKPGKDGANGNNGAEWGESGGNGKPAQPAGNAPGTFTLTIKELLFNVTILSVGGIGAKGGDGGQGANGYDGESAKQPGGIGGDGGNGGRGSNGGDAASMLTVKYASAESGIFVPMIDCIASNGGRGGDGNICGRNGKYYAGSSQPKSGSDGSSGISGQKGKSTMQLLSYSEVRSHPQMGVVKNY